MSTIVKPRPVMNLKVNEMSYLTCGFDVRSAVNPIKTKNFDPDEPLIISGIANEAKEDRMREIVDPGGVDLRAFQSNNILLFQHNHNEAVGLVTMMQALEMGLKFEAEVGRPDRAPLTQRQKDTRSLIAQRILKTVSIGFIPLEIQPASFDDQGTIIEPLTIKRSELLELSVVAVPANSGSIFDLKSFTYQLQSFSQLAKAVTVDTKGIEELTEAQMDEVKELLKALADRLKSVADGIKSITEGQESFQKQVLDKLDASKAKPKDDDDEDDEEKKALKKKLEGATSKAKESDDKIDDLTKKLEGLTEKFSEVLEKVGDKL